MRSAILLVLSITLWGESAVAQTSVDGGVPIDAMPTVPNSTDNDEPALLEPELAAPFAVYGGKVEKEKADDLSQKPAESESETQP